MSSGTSVRHRSKAAARPLAAALEGCLAAISHRPAALLTDIDGTLSRIVPRPEDATVDSRVARALEKLARQLELVGVITAREESVARRMVGARGIVYVGNYGLAPGAATISRDAVEAARARIEPGLAALPCVTLEDKVVAFALHYRNCDEPDAIRSRLIDLVTPVVVETGLRLLEGKKVVELVPALLPDKRSAFVQLVEQAGARSVVYLGDDISDIAVFEEIARRRREGALEGLAIAVTDGETDAAVREAADLTLGSVDEVAGLLERLAARLRPAGGPPHA